MNLSNSKEYFRLFFETAQAILSAKSMQDTLGSMVESIVEVMNVKAGSLLLIDDQDKSFKLASSCGLSSTYLRKGTLSVDLSIPEVMTGKPVYIKDAYLDQRIQYPEAMRAEGINTILSVPMIVDGTVQGLLRLYTAEVRDYGPIDIEFVSALAEMGGLAIVNAQRLHQKGDKLKCLFEEMGIDQLSETGDFDSHYESCTFLPIDPARHIGYFRTLHEITKAILSTLDSKKVMDLIVDKVVNCLQVKGCALRLRNETSHSLELVAASGLSKAFLAKGDVHTDLSISDSLQGKPVLIADTSCDSRLEYPAETIAEGIHSILSLPIIAKQRVIGVMRLYSKDKREYSREDISFLSAIAEIAGIAILNAKFYEKTRNDLSFWSATAEYLKN
ncbi:MAG: GAF domain-containing protein [Deltaproteobacteria bacterium]|jgi:signal transduction protein with GAF and PtsI domain|nr:GAF domain-containing protein [Deltaproteobacteria bacterium]